MYNDNPSGWMWLMMALFMVGFWVLVFVAIGSLWPASRRTAPQFPPQGPREVLDARLARGEITIAEHRDLLEQLSGSGKTPAR